MSVPSNHPPRTLAERYGAVAFDLDGVLYQGSRPVPAAPPTLARLRELPVRILFLTNNSARTPGRVAERLSGMGIEAGPDDVLTSAQATAAMLRAEVAPGSTAFVIGERGIREALDEAGVRAVDGNPDKTDLVVVGWDRSLDYEKLRRAVILVQRGARLVATNADASYPGPDGMWPGAGALLAAVTTATGATATIVGKPARPMFDVAAERLQIPGRTAPLMVGDRLDTDISGAAVAGWDCLLVWSGVSKPSDLMAAQDLPTYVASDVAAVLRDLPPGRFRPGRRGDARAVADLLASSGLAAAGAESRMGSTVVCERPGGGLAATASLEDSDGLGLLRSVAVAPDLRGAGLGMLAVGTAVRAGRSRGVKRVFLFTDTASAFFERLGFHAVDRDGLPDSIRLGQAREECAPSATVMVTELPG